MHDAGAPRRPPEPGWGTRDDDLLAISPETGTVIGGLLGHTRWRWLYVAKLWVDERARGHDIGTRFMARAEEIARAAGRTDAMLDTFEYQARPFYERLGYTVYATLG